MGKGIEEREETESGELKREKAVALGISTGEEYRQYLRRIEPEDDASRRDDDHSEPARLLDVPPGARSVPRSDRPGYRGEEHPSLNCRNHSEGLSQVHRGDVLSDDLAPALPQALERPEVQVHEHLTRD